MSAKSEAQPRRGKDAEIRDYGAALCSFPR
jgi:hypothetical protein